MASKVIVLDAALTELEEVADWYAEINTSLATDFVEEFTNNVKAIQNKPLNYPTLNEGFRKCSLKRFPYKIIFKIVANNILVVAIAHHKRKPNYWKNRK
ncbi:MAG: type II toxin-antitoxin system RelE/ParE family toxin [Chitinophagales bacterium]|nr:type II toxin-antitoxin system RelE/ParE family toxin [Chitinophagales bacterium]